MVRFSTLLAAAAVVGIAAAPALATPGTATGDYHYDLGDYSATHIDQTGTGLGSYGATAGKAKVSVAFALTPYVVVNVRASNGNPSSVANGTGTLTYSYAASFTAATGLALPATNAISVRGRTNLSATDNAQATAQVGDTFLACYGNSPGLSNGCGHSDFTALTTPGGVTSVDLGNGTSRYTYSDVLQITGTVAAFENYNPNTPNLKAIATAYVDPLISLDPDFLTLAGGYDPDVQLSPGAVNALGPLDPPVAGVPEPAIWALLLAGFATTGAAQRRRRSAAAA